jgi:prepilin-type N-terminal cleavage/methylation domain-containing protein
MAYVWKIQGFTLVETMIAMGLMSLVALGASKLFITGISQLHRVQVRASLNDEAKTLGSYLISRVQGVGGGVVRPWAGIWVEDACGVRNGLPDCSGSDRLSLATADATLPECQVQSINASNHVIVNLVSGICCMTAAYANRQAVVTAGITYHVQYFVTNVDTAGCSADLVPGQAFGGLNSPPPALSGWNNGGLTIAQVSTFYVDMSTHYLNEYQDLDNNGAIDPGEVNPVSDRVADLQLALAYDSNPTDGQVPITYDTADEWLYDATGAGEALGSGGLVNAKPSLLRMAAVGVVMAQVNQKAAKGGAFALNGPMRSNPGWQYRNSLSFARFRNLDLFQLGLYFVNPWRAGLI